MEWQGKQINVKAAIIGYIYLFYAGLLCFILFFVASEALPIDGISFAVFNSSPFSVSTWFYALTVLFAVSLTGIFFQLKMRNMRKRIRVLEMEVSEGTVLLEKVKKSQGEIAEKAHREGMADIATSVLHNVGNVLNSVNTSSSLIKEKIKQSKLSNLIQANTILREHIHDIDRFVTENPKGKKLLEYYLSLEEPMKNERDELVALLDRLTQKINQTNEVIAAQQSYAGTGRQMELASLSEMIDYALVLESGTIEGHNLNVKKKLNAPDQVAVHRSKLIQVLVNIIKNAKESMEDNHPENKNLFIETWQNEDMINLSVTDSGTGIESEYLDKIFSHAFTTKSIGHGFGLHSSANYMTEMGGKIEVTSKGRGKGATFTLMLQNCSAVVSE